MTSEEGVSDVRGGGLVTSEEGVSDIRGGG